jgi:serine/alanine adding enzyme
VIFTSEIDKNKWLSLFNCSRFKSPFQTIESLELHKKALNFECEVFAVENDNCYLAGVIIVFISEPGIKRIFSSRGIIYGGPLIKDSKDSKKAIKLLFKNLNRQTLKKPIYFELRCSFDYSEYSEDIISAGWKFNHHLNVLINLKNVQLEELIKKMTYNRRREISLSFKNGASVSEAENIHEVKELYYIVKELFSKTVKLPMPSFSFFESIYYSIIGKVFIVKHKEFIIGGAFCIFNKESTINTLYYAGLRNYHKKIFPTHLAIYQAIQFGLDNNLTQLDLMGAGKPGIDYGVRKYKVQFGGEIANHGRYLLVSKHILYTIGKFYIKLRSLK